MTTDAARASFHSPGRSAARCRVSRAAGWVALVGIAACSASSSDGDSAQAETLGDAGPATGGQGLCGQEGEPCCAVPLRECAVGGLCNPATALCEVSALGSGISRLCRSALDCPATEACCQAGLLSSCVALPPNAQCPTVDLAIEPDPASTPVLATTLVEPLTCSSACLNLTGAHRLLRVDARVISSGTSDLMIGAPGAPGVRIAPGTEDHRFSSGCPEYSYAEDLVRLELLGADDGAYSRIDARLSPGCLGGSKGPFDCSFLGLVRGVNSSALGCVELPIDGVPPGDYKLRFTIDPNDRIAETDESNNTYESIVSLPRLDVLGACPPIAAGARPLESDCGWTAAWAAPCNPGQIVSLGCPDCPTENDPVLRVCAGSEPCRSDEVIISNDDATSGVFCPQVSFLCPAAGAYSSFIKDYRGDTPVCNVRTLTASTPP